MDYHKLDYLGRGTYGKVYKGRNTMGEFVAIKQGVYKHDIFGFGNLRELDHLNALKGSQLCVQLLDYVIQFEHKKMSEPEIEKKESLIFITELADCSGEEYFLNRSLCTPDVGVNFACQLLLAIEYMHLKRITHRDIKPQNILIFKKPNQYPQLKLCDFGFSNHLCNHAQSTPNIATPAFKAPEMTWRITDYKYSCDVWAASLVIYQIFTGKHLMNGNIIDDDKIFINILESIPNKFTKEHLKLYTEKSNFCIKLTDYNPSNKNFMETFSELYNYKSFSSWHYVEKLLLDGFNYDYIARKSCTLLLTNPLFNSLTEYIKNIRELQWFNNVLDIIKIKRNDVVTNFKKEVFKKVLTRHDFVRAIGLRTLFHALDLADRFFYYKPNIDSSEEVKKICHACIYVFHKYFSTTTVPIHSHYFFETPFFGDETKPENITKKEQYLRDLELWVFEFEKYVLDVLCRGKQLCRPGLFEMPDEYKLTLTNAQLQLLLEKQCALVEWNDSYRAMFRDFYNKFIDPTHQWY